jgi:hypothetical protein
VVFGLSLGVVGGLVVLLVAVCTFTATILTLRHRSRDTDSEKKKSVNNNVSQNNSYVDIIDYVIL